jgi:single-stranded-DNA-specific exonuclease
MTAEKRWVMPEKISPPAAFQAAIGGHPLVAQTLYQRGYRTIETAQAFLNPAKYQPAPPTDLPDLDGSLRSAGHSDPQGQHILVWGDFDVDGQTATTLLVEGLRQVGAKVSYHIPVRAEESHGITREALKARLATGFDLLLTCDTGITEYDNLQMVRNLDIPVIVTDHHTLGERLPPANAVINPQRLAAGHPLRTLPGVGVAYKLIEGCTPTWRVNWIQGTCSSWSPWALWPMSLNFKVTPATCCSAGCSTCGKPTESGCRCSMKKLS